MPIYTSCMLKRSTGRTTTTTSSNLPRIDIAYLAGQWRAELVDASIGAVGETPEAALAALLRDPQFHSTLDPASDGVCEVHEFRPTEGGKAIEESVRRHRTKQASIIRAEVAVEIALEPAGARWRSYVSAFPLVTASGETREEAVDACRQEFEAQLAAIARQVRDRSNPEGSRPQVPPIAVRRIRKP
jgi:predicted RNase H-like HicB family nuclease